MGMNFEVEVNGRTRMVTVERVAAGSQSFRVTVDGAPHLVDAVAVEADTISLVFPEAGGASHDVGFSNGLSPSELVVYLPSGSLTATVNGRRSRRAAEMAASGEQRIVAPMPGKVLRVLASPGDEVAARQPIVVVEAMKMENELAPPRGGRVRDVTVSAGESVEAGRLLAIVE
jgi:biotin carboxyl carrier protein